MSKKSKSTHDMSSNKLSGFTLGRFTIAERENLFKIAPYLSSSTRKKLGLDIPVLVYVQDPQIVDLPHEVIDPRLVKIKTRESIQTIYVPNEPDIGRGPTSSRIAVVDYDADTNKLEDPIEWDNRQRRFYLKHKTDIVWLSADHYDTPQFHQVNVWGIVQSILSMYESASVLDRSAPWAFDGGRIILVPHAGEARNAFYDRDSKSIQFYYFHSGNKRVDTCLSHDIIAHETGHAILDGIRPLYLNEITSIQTSAFHEFIADLTAIMAALLNDELRLKAADESKGDFSKDTIISSLAEEYGYYSTGRPYLRTAKNKLTMAKVKANKSPHDWSQVLTGAMFDILTQIVAIHMRKGNLELSSIQKAYDFAATRLRRLAFQPLDYLPPVDVQFSDYARAVIRADEIYDPLDDSGYRVAVKQVFKKRGINCNEENPEHRYGFRSRDFDRLSRTRADAYYFLHENRKQLYIPEEQDISVVDLYQTDKPISQHSDQHRETIVQYTWREYIKLEGNDYGSLQDEYVSLLCGGTMAFDNRGHLLSWQRKPGTERLMIGGQSRSVYDDEREKGNQRKEELLAYLRDLIAMGELGYGDLKRTAGDNISPSIMTQRGRDGIVKMTDTQSLL